MRWSWNQPICFDCFWTRSPNREPVRLKAKAFDSFEAMIEVCVDCGRFTIECIWMRVDPADARYPTKKKDDE